VDDSSARFFCRLHQSLPINKGTPARKVASKFKLCYFFFNLACFHFFDNECRSLIYENYVGNGLKFFQHPANCLNGMFNSLFFNALKQAVKFSFLILFVC
jgi:hypothetical protein